MAFLSYINLIQKPTNRNVGHQIIFVNSVTGVLTLSHDEAKHGFKD